MKQLERNQFKKKYGQWAVVTGASCGIGRAIATELAVKGLSLVLVARNRTELERIASQNF